MLPSKVQLDPLEITVIPKAVSRKQEHNEKAQVLFRGFSAIRKIIQDSRGYFLEMK